MEQPFIGNLKPHPLNKQIYGKEKLSAELVASIEKYGLLTPLVVTKDRLVISGNRRLAALKHLTDKSPRFEQVNVIVFRGSDLEAKRLLIESNRQRVKTEGQVAREVAELLCIERLLAGQRQKLGTVRAVPPQGNGKASDLVATRLGLGRKKVEQAAAIVNAAKKKGNEKAKQELNRLDKDETTIGAAFRAISTPKQTDQFQRFFVIKADLDRLENRIDTLLSRKKDLTRLSESAKLDIVRRIKSAQKKLQEALKLCE